VLVTLWPVEDTSARLLMSRLYGELEHGAVQMRPAAALRSAQRYLCDLPLAAARELLDDEPPGDAALPYADPRFWAAYVMIGASE
jgi:CHAT domain-containing protein